MVFRPHRGAARLCMLGMLSLVPGLPGLLAPPALAADPTLREAGSTLLYPLFQRWVPDYAAANPGITITTDATGSGDGIVQAIAGHVQIGASDAYMSDDEVEQNPLIINVPMAISEIGRAHV